MYTLSSNGCAFEKINRRKILKKVVLAALSIFNISFASENHAWKIHGELSYVKTSGNSDIETFATKVEAKKDAFINRYNAKAEFLYGKADDKENTNKLYLLGRWERLFSKRAFGFIQGDYLRDKFSGYDYRSVLGAGIGYDILKSKKHYLKGLASLGYAFEDMKDKGTDDFMSGKLEMNYIWNVRENLRFKEDLDYLQSFKDKTVYYINSTTGLEVKINAHFSLGVAYKVNYQHRPPTVGIKKTDTTFLTSLVFDF
ncbi:MAG: DUF481 domain-containing protein [Aquificota bacterium]|nr:MAG: DUF481 domain-containing protein [Aquificota bacterium]